MNPPRVVLDQRYPAILREKNLSCPGLRKNQSVSLEEIRVIMNNFSELDAWIPLGFRLDHLDHLDRLATPQRECFIQWELWMVRELFYRKKVKKVGDLR
jgi:hypothetical protein